MNRQHQHAVGTVLGAIAASSREIRSVGRKVTVKRAIEKAAEVVVLSAHLYRELAVSAMGIIHLRSTSEPETR